MNITIIYKESYETSCGHLEEYLKTEFNFEFIELSKVLRHHISNKTDLGNQCLEFINSGRSVPKLIFFEIFKLELGKCYAKNVAIKGYPNSIEQVQLFKKLCQVKDYTIKKIWHLKGINTVKNILANPKYSMIIEKYDSKEYAIQQALRSRKIIENNMKQLNQAENTVLFESEALGIKFKDDKYRIIEEAKKHYR